MNVIIAFLILCFLLIIGVPVAFAFLGSIAYLIFFAGYDPSILLPYGSSQLNNLVILAIPLFIIAGGIIQKGGIGERLVDIVEILVGRIKGGLGIVVILSSAVFGSITGSAAATLSSIGGIMFPKLQKAGYPTGYASALMANSSVLGMLIPPSSIMILYAWLGNQSVLRSFLATIIPGIILIVLLIIFNSIAIRKVDLKRQEPIIFTHKKSLFGKKVIQAIPALLMPVLILGGIYGGIMTPTEAAAVGALYAIFVGFFIYRELKVKTFVEILVDTATTTGVIMIMLFAVMIIGRLYIMEDLPGTILNILYSISDERFFIILIINIFMIIIGMLMDDVSAVLLCTPILLPIAREIGIDPIHFAAILAVNLGMGNITPPTAPLLYLAGRLSKAQINQSIKPALLMILFCWIPTLLITTYFPELSLFLPNLILGK